MWYSYSITATLCASEAKIWGAIQRHVLIPERECFCISKTDVNEESADMMFCRTVFAFNDHWHQLRI